MNKTQTASKGGSTVNAIRRGDVTKIAEKTGFSISYVSRVISGTRSNEKITKVANKIFSRRKG